MRTESSSAPPLPGSYWDVAFGILSSVISQTTVHALLADLHRRLQALVPHAALVLVYRDARQGAATVRDFAGDEVVPAGVRFPLEHCPLSAVISSGNRSEIFDPGTPDFASRYPEVVKYYRKGGVRSACYLPLICQTGVFGGIVIASRQPAAFTPHELDFLEKAMPPVALAISAILRREELLEERARLRLISEVDRAITGTLAVDRLLAKVAGALAVALPESGFAVALWNPQAKELRLRIAVHPGEEPDFGALSWPLVGSAVGLAFSTGQPQFFDGESPTALSPQLRELYWLRGYRCSFAVPLLTPRSRIGALAIASRRHAEASAHYRTILNDLAPRIAIAVESALVHEQLEQSNAVLRRDKVLLESAARNPPVLTDLVFESGAMKEMVRAIEAVGPSGATVLIQGETGTGKERVARAIHFASLGSAGPFIALSCAALTSTLIESELFGHEKGAFTGAIVQRAGRFEMAHKGTLFLDEIGEMPLELQPKLLRVLEEREFERVGGSRPVRVDVRIVVATHRDLEKMVRQGRFREDLYYRLSVIPLTVPPLRERPADIAPLTRHFIKQFSSRYGKEVMSISPDALRRLEAYAWPGNVRELQNVIERAVILCTGDVLHIFGLDLAPPVGLRSRSNLTEVERTVILEALAKCRGVIGGPRGAAALLGLKRTTLLHRMEKLGIFLSKTASADTSF